MRKTFAGFMSALFILVCLMSGPVMAQEPFVLVPDQPGGGGVAVNGCFRADRDLFGPYRLTFCLERRGTYQIRGGGVRCDGRLDFDVRRRDIFIDLHRTSCGNGVAWEAAAIDCSPIGGVGVGGRVIVPDVPVLSSLRCTYHPTVRGVSSRTFNAHRI